MTVTNVKITLIVISLCRLFAASNTSTKIGSDVTWDIFFFIVCVFIMHYNTHHVRGTLEDFSWLCVHANNFRIKCNHFRKRSTLYTPYIPVAHFPKCSIFSRQVSLLFICIEIKLFLSLTSNYCISWWFEKSSHLFNRVQLLTSCMACQQYGHLSVIYS